MNKTEGSVLGVVVAGGTGSDPVCLEFYRFSMFVWLKMFFVEWASVRSQTNIGKSRLACESSRHFGGPRSESLPSRL
jgi:hypothetical protein